MNRLLLLAGCLGFCALSPIMMKAASLSGGRVDYVVPCIDQGHTNNPAVVWYDDFDQDRIHAYLEPRSGSPDAALSRAEAVGGRGASMECYYAQGSQGRGNRKLVFGDSPIGKPLRKGEAFSRIYWRIYVKHQTGWRGEAAKLSRATGIVSASWNQAFISHVWSSGIPLTLDPVTGVSGERVVTRRYNDFEKFKWLGNSPAGHFPFHSPEEAGRWICVESMVQINSPGQADGSAVLWVDGKLDAERKGLNLRGNYQGRGSSINAIFLEAYWNEGSPTNQFRWYDDFVVSTEPIGAITADRDPVLVRRPDPCDAWQLQIGSEAGVLWESEAVPNDTLRLKLNDRDLPERNVYWCRIRLQEKDQWGMWSDWHQPFKRRN